MNNNSKATGCDCIGEVNMGDCAVCGHVAESPLHRSDAPAAAAAEEDSDAR